MSGNLSYAPRNTNSFQMDLFDIDISALSIRVNLGGMTIKEVTLISKSFRTGASSLNTV